MSEAKKEMKKTPTPKPVPEVAAKCPVEKCAKASQRMHFCSEHFDWFKAGLVNKRGETPSDFDKKYQTYLRKQIKSA